MSMNLCLTGEIQVGKSTLLRRLLRESGKRFGGFSTVFLGARGTPGAGLCLVPFGETEGSEESVCARFGEHGREALSQTFDTVGTRLIRAAMEDERVEIIVMDELGFLEADAALFRRTVLEAMRGPKPVWAVVRHGARPGELCSLWQDAPVGKLVTVTAENRERISVTELFREE